MTENYEIIRQILFETLEVKLQYENVIKRAMEDKECRRLIRKIVAEEKSIATKLSKCGDDVKLSPIASRKPPKKHSNRHMSHPLELKSIQMSANSMSLEEGKSMSSQA